MSPIELKDLDAVIVVYVPIVLIGDFGQALRDSEFECCVEVVREKVSGRLPFRFLEEWLFKLTVGIYILLQAMIAKILDVILRQIRRPGLRSEHECKFR